MYDVYRKANVKPFELVFGYEYILWFNNKPRERIRLIQTSPKGFNFLVLDTCKCIFKRPLYAAHGKTSKYNVGDKIILYCHEDFDFSTPVTNE